MAVIYGELHFIEIFTSLAREFINDEPDSSYVANLYKFLTFLLKEDGNNLDLYVEGIYSPEGFKNFKILRKKIESELKGGYPIDLISETLKDMERYAGTTSRKRYNNQNIVMYKSAWQIQKLRNQTEELANKLQEFLKAKQKLLKENLLRLHNQLELIDIIQNYENNELIINTIVREIIEILTYIGAFVLDGYTLAKLLQSKDQRAVVFAGETHADRFRSFFENYLKSERLFYSSAFRSYDDYDRCVKIPDIMK